MITLALSKGRIFEETMPLLKTAGIEALEDPERSRKLIIGTVSSKMRPLERARVITGGLPAARPQL